MPAIEGERDAFILRLLPTSTTFCGLSASLWWTNIEDRALLTTLAEAAHAREKADLLQHTNRKNKSTRYLIGPVKFIRLMSGDSWCFSAEELDEIPRTAAT